MWNGQKSRKRVPGVKFKRTAHSYCHKINKVLLGSLLMLSLNLCIQEWNCGQSYICIIIYSSLPPSPTSFKIHYLVVDNEKWRRRNLSVLNLPLCDSSAFSSNSSYWSRNGLSLEESSWIELLCSCCVCLNTY